MKLMVKLSVSVPTVTSMVCGRLSDTKRIRGLITLELLTARTLIHKTYSSAEPRIMIPVIKYDKVAVAQTAYQMLCAMVYARRSFVLGLAAGETQLLLYKEMVDGFKRKELDFDCIQAFILDEFLGLAPDHPKSFYTFIREHLFQYVNIRTKNIHYLDGSSKNIQLHSMNYEQQIQQCGGIDLQILGIGRNGHVGFNEPGSSLTSRTGVITLLPETIADSRGYFGSAKTVPRYALTMGIGTMLEAKHIMLLATGSQKAEAVAAMVEGPLTSMCPASALQIHPHVTIICDEEAVVGLKHKEMYAWVLQNQYNT